MRFTQQTIVSEDLVRTASPRLFYVADGVDDVLDAGVDAVRGVDVGALAAPASGPGGQIGDPQRVAPPVGGLQQGHLGAGVGRSRRAKTRIVFGHAFS